MANNIAANAAVVNSELSYLSCEMRLEAYLAVVALGGGKFLSSIQGMSWIVLKV